jgi:hypothetical protein
MPATAGHHFFGERAGSGAGSSNAEKSIGVDVRSAGLGSKDFDSNALGSPAFGSALSVLLACDATADANGGAAGSTLDVMLAVVCGTTGAAGASALRTG